MNKEELTPFIIKELGRHRERQDIVNRICEKSTLSWTEAEQMIDEVESQNRRTIAGRQGPLLIFLSIATMILGIALIAYNMEILLAIFQQDLLGQILSLQSGYYRAAALITGLAMAVGGLYGLWTSLASLLPE